MNIINTPVLVLNGSFEPIQIASAKRALKMLTKGIAIVEETHDTFVHCSWQLPSVIRLKTYVQIPIKLKVASRKNIYQRDKNTCQYCRKVFPAAQLTLDHIMPSSRGGKSSFSNLVSCCVPCNRLKADKTPEEANMPLLHVPREVTLHTTRGLLRSAGEQDKKWRKYLYFDHTPHPNQFSN